MVVGLGVLLVALIAILVIAAIVGGIVLLVRVASKPSAPQQYPAGPALTQPAGWYPDPQYPNLMRYFDGRQWTSSTQPRG